MTFKTAFVTKILIPLMVMLFLVGCSQNSADPKDPDQVWRHLNTAQKNEILDAHMTNQSMQDQLDKLKGEHAMIEELLKNANLRNAQILNSLNDSTDLTELRQIVSTNNSTSKHRDTNDYGTHAIKKHLFWLHKFQDDIIAELEKDSI